VSITAATFAELYQQQAPGAFRRARCLLRSEADAHEVVHDLFVSLLERPQQYAARGDITAFMYKAITHACLNRLRNQRKRARLLHEHVVPRMAPQPRAAPAEQLATLVSELSRMPESLAVVAVYYFVDGMTHDEIALLLGCSARRVGHLVAQVEGWSAQEQRT
jgi:RNA polymerase sigma-70 factor (ECF subfamily)